MKRLRNKQLVIVLVGLTLVVAAVGVWLKRHQTKPVVNTGMGPTHQSESGSSSAANSQSSGTAQNPSFSTTAGNSQPAASQPAVAPPPKPTGQITNSYPNPVGYNENIETSCQTVAGATCDIEITGPDGKTKLLGAKTADQMGAVLFEWKPSQTGVRAGNWKLALIATKNGVSSAGDSYNLTVNP